MNAQAKLEVQPSAVWKELRRIRAADIQLGTKRLTKCTVLTNTHRGRLRTPEVPEPE